MDLRRLRTFVTTAELGTVSRAALHLRISQSALSRQISDLEQEFRVRLFDRVGRRLVLTTVGEELLGDCRSVLGQVGSLGERVELLRGGDRGVLKVAASPQMIESVLSAFLPRYAARFPNVRVNLTEALGPAQVTLLDRGEVHLGIRHDQGVDPCLASYPLLLDEILAACNPSLDIGAAEILMSGALHPIRCCCWNRVTPCACNSMPSAVWQTSSPTSCSKAARLTSCLSLAETGQGVAIIPSLLRTDRYALRILRVIHRGEPLRERLVIQWDKRRPLLPYAESFREALAEYMREIFPITQPTQSKTVAIRKQVAVRKARGQ